VLNALFLSFANSLSFHYKRHNPTKLTVHWTKNDFS